MRIGAEPGQSLAGAAPRYRAFRDDDVPPGRRVLEIGNEGDIVSEHDDLPRLGGVHEPIGNAFTANVVERGHRIVQYQGRSEFMHTGLSEVGGQA